jgi:hypothetical protein
MLLEGMELIKVFKHFIINLKKENMLLHVLASQKLLIMIFQLLTNPLGLKQQLLKVFGLSDQPMLKALELIMVLV